MVGIPLTVCSYFDKNPILVFCPYLPCWNLVSLNNRSDNETRAADYLPRKLLYKLPRADRYYTLAWHVGWTNIWRRYPEVYPVIWEIYCSFDNLYEDLVWNLIPHGFLHSCIRFDFFDLLLKNLCHFSIYHFYPPGGYYPWTFFVVHVFAPGFEFEMQPGSSLTHFSAYKKRDIVPFHLRIPLGGTHWSRDLTILDLRTPGIFVLSS